MLNNTEQIFNQINKANKIAVVFNKNWFGDSLAAALACYLFLQKLGKTVDIIAEDNVASLFSFLPAFTDIKNKLIGQQPLIIELNTEQTPVDQVKYQKSDQILQFIITSQRGHWQSSDVTVRAGAPEYDLLISLGCPDLEALGSLYQQHTDFFYITPLINIDNQASNENYGQINLVDLNAVASCEILFDLLSAHDSSLLDSDIATCLLAGIISQTKSFKTNNTTPQALLTVSELMQLGARREEIINHLYRNKNVQILQLWGKTLANLQGGLNNKFIWSVLTAEDFQQTQTTPADLTNIIDELIISIPQAMAIMLVVQNGDGQATAFVHSVKNINSLDLIKEYNPSGSKYLAKLKLTVEPHQAAQRLAELIISKLEKLDL